MEHPAGSDAFCTVAVDVTRLLPLTLATAAVHSAAVVMGARHVPALSSTGLRVTTLEIRSLHGHSIR
eukprot:6560047-Prymnesium_polylepis.1